MGVYTKHYYGIARSLNNLDIPDAVLDAKVKEAPKKMNIRQKAKSQRCRRRMSQLLHTHVVLIAVCILSALDATCVLGQIICDILIMTEIQHDNDVLQNNAVKEFTKKCQVLHGYANKTETPPLETIVEELGKYSSCGDSIQEGGSHHNSDHYFNDEVYYEENIVITHPRYKRAAGGDDVHHHGEHSVTHEITHVFHLGSLIILSILVLETLLKIAGTGRKFLRHKLEVFDAFVIIVSWALDVGFWEGIWAHPGTEAATILIIILPWRVVRIVNSFILVIEEKDLVQLKIVKQQYRRVLKRAKIIRNKMDAYKVESRQLQGLCRKYAIQEHEIVSCAPIYKQRRRSSLGAAFSSFASLAMITTVGSQPELDKDSSSSEDESTVDAEIKRNEREFFRSMSVGSELSNSTVSFTLSPDNLDTPSTPGADPIFTFSNDLPTSQMKNSNLNEGHYTKL